MKFESRVSSMSTEDIIADTIGEEAAKKLLYEVGGITGRYAWYVSPLPRSIRESQ